MLRRKLVGLIHWWLQLAPVRHSHWCESNSNGMNDGRCEHQTACWYCEGVFCINQERKNCPGCERGQPCNPKLRMPYGPCACGLSN